MKLFAFLSNGKKYKEMMAASQSDLKNLLAEDREIYKTCKITLQEIGIYFFAKGIPSLIRYEDLKLNTRQEVRTLKQPMVDCVLKNDFSNDNTTFFMLERGLVNEERNELSDKGVELKTLLTA